MLEWFIIQYQELLVEISKLFQSLNMAYMRANGENLASGLEVIKLFSCLTQLSTKFQLLIKTKIPTNEEVSLSYSDVIFIMLINVKMPTTVGISTFMSRINFLLS